MTKGRVPILTFGERLRVARDHAHIESQDMAKHFDVSRHTITNWEKDRTEPSRAEIMEWARLTDTDFDWLLHGSVVEESSALGISKEQLAQLLVAQLLGTDTVQRRRLTDAEWFLAPDSDIYDLAKLERELKEAV